MRRYVFLFALALIIMGCSQDDANQTDNDIIKVSLKLNGDIVSSDSPITRADTESRDLIGITVYKGTQQFAYGIFDNLDDVSIYLKAGSNYKFKCTLIKEAKDKLYFSSTSETSTERFKYTDPFSWRIKCNDPFTYSTSFTDDLNSGYVSCGYSSGSLCTPIDRFYGELAEYSPTVNGVVNIDLKRVSFGLQLKVTGITDGSVDVTCKNDSKTFDSQTGLIADYESTATLFSMKSIYNAWQYADADYQEQVKVSVKWTRGVGVTQDLGTKTVNVKRNCLNIIHVKMSSNDDGASVGVRTETTAMGNEAESLSN